MDYITVSKGETKTVTGDDAVSVLATFNIGPDIVLTCYNPATKTAGMARTQDMGQVQELVSAIAADGGQAPQPVIQARLVGGDDSETAREQVLHIIQVLGQVDEGRNVINIVSADINAKPHPDSFRMTAFDGNLSLIEE